MTSVTTHRMRRAGLRATALAAATSPGNYFLVDRDIAHTFFTAIAVWTISFAIDVMRRR